jgi:hypothetical protein
MDGSEFDALIRTLAAPSSRRVALSGPLAAFGLALAEAVALAKKKGKGHHNKGRRGNKNKNNEKKKEHCTAAGTECTFSVHPCCGDTLCCDPENSGFRTCLPPEECCGGVVCSGLDNRDCGPNCTCQNRDLLSIGTCLPDPSL